jgi:[protein-PII] uridylyltransferase
VDVFYLTDSDGSPLEDEDARTTAKSVLDRLTF